TVPEVHMLIGHANIKLRAYPEAVSAYTKAAEHGADPRDVSLGIALAYEGQSNVEAADMWEDRAARAARGEHWATLAADAGTTAQDTPPQDDGIEQVIDATEASMEATDTTSGDDAAIAEDSAEVVSDESEAPVESAEGVDQEAAAESEAE